MGIHYNIGFDKFPIQSDWVGKKVKVTFHYNLDKTIKGTIVRDDNQDPYQMIIQLDDNRYVRSVECQYSLMND